MSRDPHWLLLDRERLEEAKRLAAQYKPQFRPGEPLATHYTDPTYEQINRRIAQAGSSLSSPTWLADLNAAYAAQQDGLGNLELQVWIEVRQTTAGADNPTLLANQTFTLQTSLDGTNWYAVDDASGQQGANGGNAWVQMVADAGFADGDAISTDQLSGVGNNYISGEAQETDDESDAITFTTDDTSYTNLAYSVQLLDAGLTSADSVSFRVVRGASTVLDNYANSAIVQWQAPPTYFALDSYRFYKPGTESGSEPLAPESTDIRMEPGQLFHVRVGISHESGGTGIITPDWQVKLNTGAWTSPGVYAGDRTAIVHVYDDPDLTNEGATTDRSTNGISNSGTTFVSGIVLDTSPITITGTSLTANDYTEVLLSVWINPYQVEDGDTIQFRADNLLGIEDTEWPTVTVFKPRQGIRRKPGYQANRAIRRDGVWKGIHRLFAQLDPDSAELITGMRPTEYTATFNHTQQYGPFGFEWASPGSSTGRLVYEETPTGVFRDTATEREHVPRFGITNVVLMRLDPTDSISASTSLYQRYTGTTNVYPWRMLFDTNEQFLGQLYLDGTLRSTSPAIYCPRGQYMWVVQRWEKGKTQRVQFFDLNGTPISEEASTTGTYSEIDGYTTGNEGPPDDDYYALWGDSNSAAATEMVAAMTWIRELPDEELRQFFGDPWGFYEPQLEAAAAGQTVSLVAASVSVAAQAQTMSFGAVTRSLVAGTVSTAAQAQTISLGVVTRSPVAAVVSVASQAATIVVGAVTRALTAATTTGSAEPQTTSLGAVTRDISPATVSTSAQPQTITVATTLSLVAAVVSAAAQAATNLLGTVTRSISPASVTTSAQAQTTSLGAVTRSIVAAVVTTTAQAATLTLGVVSRVLSAAGATASAQALTNLAGAVTRSVSPASITATGQAQTTTLGAVNRSLVAAAVTAAAQAQTISQATTIAISPASVSATGSTLTTTVGAVTRSIVAAVVNVTGSALSLALGVVLRSLSAAGVTTTGQAQTTTLGAVTKSISPASVTASGGTQALTLGAISLNLSAAAVTASGGAQIVTVGGQVANISPAQISVTGSTVTTSVGAVTRSIVAASISAAAQGQTPSVAGLQVSLVAAGATASAQAQTLSLGAISIQLNSAQISALAGILTLSPGAVTRNLAPAVVTATAQAQSTELGLAVSISPATASAAAQALTNTVGAIDVQLSPAQVSAVGTVLSPTAGATQVSVSPASVTAGAQAMTLNIGTLFVPLSPGLILSTGGTLTYVTGEAVVGLAPAQVTGIATPLDPINLGTALPLDGPFEAWWVEPGRGALFIDPERGLVWVDPARLALFTDLTE